MNKPLIDIKNLNTGYGSQKALDNVNITVESNDFIGVIGPNGGGKTTLIKAILGLIPVWSGEIVSNLEAAKIGYLPQFNPIDKEFPITVKEVILSGLAGKKGLFNRYSILDKKRANELMEQAGIAKLKHKNIGHLSGGQMQRSLLCRALINQPELLILDEPSTFVDNQFEMELFEWLKELNKEIAIIMVSHDLGTISSHVKTIACVNQHLHYHKSNKITPEQLAHYDCPIQIITHGTVPHQVLATHKH
ncbi:MAG: metal ABC transporter ATP-binding protein [Salinivirgaceae bacterium]|nr:metal ABC transporter ATP-binding protein [Salinivirgaceae bacterium]